MLLYYNVMYRKSQ